MKLRDFWFASIMLATVAICVHAASFQQASKSMQALARAVIAPDDQKALLKTEAHEFGNKSRSIALAGFCVAMASVLCLAVSYKRHEPAWHSIPIALLGFYGLLQFAIV
ncbi:MAG TPA: hypothetical protein VN836_07500 [Verrucomicrobiae bacterium]|nr:hypothetical protein [Verrucomicrobiae bacterium]